jgi:hypothetical protein
VQDRLQPAAAVTKLNERVKKIGKVNSDIADWLQVCALVVRCEEKLLIYVFAGATKS